MASFKDHGAYEKWFESPEYQKISQDRKAATEGVILLIQGVSQPCFRTCGSLGSEGLGGE